MRINSINSGYVPSFGKPYYADPEAVRRLRDATYEKAGQSEEIEAVRTTFERSKNENLSVTPTGKKGIKLELTNLSGDYPQVSKTCRAKAYARDPRKAVDKLRNKAFGEAYSGNLADIRNSRAEKAARAAAPAEDAE